MANQKEKIKVKWEQTDKQCEVWGYLTDKTTTDILFGGGAGGAKSFTGCAWIITMCGKYPGTRWVIGRKKLKTLKETTLRTFWDVCRKWGIKEGRDYKFNAQDNVITFTNGSEVLLKELFLWPSDPEFDSLGSLEITGAFVDEANQVVYKAIEVLKSRMRYLLDEYGLIPKLLMTCNPAKNWVYMEFYAPFKKGVLEAWRKFVQSLAKDNPFLSQNYILQLSRTKDKNLKERLEKGNWEYDDDPAAMFSFESITDLFTNKVENTEGKFISGDISRKGNDNMPIGYWEGFQLKEIHVLPYEIRKDTKLSSKWISDFAEGKGVRHSHIVLDEDGLGGGVVDQIPGCVGFINNSSPIQAEEFKWKENKQNVNYTNLKSQCYFALAQMVEDGLIGIDEVSDMIRNSIIEELGVVKQKDFDNDGKLAVIGKPEMKDILGRSPDFADMIMMRMVFTLKKEKKLNIRLL